VNTTFRALVLVVGCSIGGGACVDLSVPTPAPTTAPTPTLGTTPSAAPTETPTDSPAPTATPTLTPTLTPPTITFDELNANAELATYHDLESDSIDWVAHTLYFKGIVVWVVPNEPQGALMGIEIDRQHDTVYTRYTGTDTFTEGRWVEFVGQYSGLFSYTTDSGEEITLPAFQSLGQQNIRLAAVASFDDELSACTDRAHRVFGWRWTGSYDWSFNAASTPSGLDADAVLTVLKRSVENITDARNDCGLPDNVNATAHFVGVTDEPTGVTARPACPAADGLNVVGFGKLPRNLLGLTCPVWHDDVLTEVDISFNSRVEWALSPDTCIFGELLEATATHEFGHAFGLAHVSESKHGDLTMSTTSNGPCEGAEISLGLGDVLGLEQLYP
jgi:hypothetical protein